MYWEEGVLCRCISRVSNNFLYQNSDVYYNKICLLQQGLLLYMDNVDSWFDYIRMCWNIGIWFDYIWIILTVEDIWFDYIWSICVSFGFQRWHWSSWIYFCLCTCVNVCNGQWYWWGLICWFQGKVIK